MLPRLSEEPMRTLILTAIPLALACAPGKSGGDTGAVTDGGSSDGGSDGGATGDGGSDGGTSDGGSGDGGGEELCDVEVESTVPEDGDSDIYYRSEITFQLSDADETAVITVVSDDGVAADGTTWWDADEPIVYFTPTEGLSPDTDYTATLTYCSGTEAVEFTTSELGTPVEDTDDLVGNVYALDLSSARWLEPEGVAEFIKGQLTTSLLVSVESVGDELELLGAMSEESADSQDVCLPTTDFPAADFSEQPYFQIGPEDLSLSLGGYDAYIRDFELSGAFSSDGDEISEGEIIGQLDIRDIADALGGTLGTTDPAEICGYLIFLGAECATCDSDGEEYCMDVHIDQVDAPLVDESMEVIDQQDCHVDCKASYTNADCDTSGW
jgi:Bacterial Ig-like domain